MTTSRRLSTTILGDRQWLGLSLLSLLLLLLLFSPGVVSLTKSPTKAVAYNDIPSTRIVFRDIELTLPGVSRLDTEGKAVWTNVTKQWYKDFYARTEPLDRRRRLQRLSSAGVADLETNLIITDQRVTLSDQGEPINTLVYAQELDYKVIDDKNLRTPDELVLIPFARPTDNADYVTRLQAADLAIFGDLDTVEPVELPIVPGFNDRT